MTLVLEDMEVDALFTVKTANDLQIKGVSSGGAATIDLTGPGNGAYYSGIQLGDDVFPFDGAGHYWGVLHTTDSHDFQIFNYNGTDYTNVLEMNESGGVWTKNNVLDDGFGDMRVLGAITNSTDGSHTSNKASWIDTNELGGGLLMYNAGDDMVYQIAADIYSVGSDLPWIAGLSGGWVVTSAFDHTGTASFAVGNSTTSGPGLGNAPFTVFDDFSVTTFNNTLDDGFGNMTVAGTFVAQADAYTVHNTLDDGSGDMFVNGVFTATNAIVLNHAGSSAFIVAVGASDGNSYSNLELADNVYPLDAAGHYWSFSHRVTTHELLIYNYNGSSYENRLIITEGGAVETAINTLDNGSGFMVVVALETTGAGGITVDQGGIGITAGGLLISADGASVAGGITITSGTFKVVAGSTSVGPMTFQSGTNLTTAAAGVVEFDGKAFYATAAASSRQVISAQQLIALTADYTLTNNTSAQKLFNSPSNGSLTVQGSTTYFFEACFYVTGMTSSSHAASFGFGGTATFTSAMMNALAGVAAQGATTSTAAVVATATQIIPTSSTGTTLQVTVKGTLRINAGGTIIPQLTQTTASAAAVVKSGSYFRLWPVGSNTVASVGNWT